MGPIRFMILAIQLSYWFDFQVFGEGLVVIWVF
jgi:hypothetical protein